MLETSGKIIQKRSQHMKGWKKNAYLVCQYKMCKLEGGLFQATKQVT